MITDALTDLYVYLPAFAANAAPVIAKNIPFLRSLNRPVYATYMGKNKTWRGFLAGLIAAAIVGLIQYLLSDDVTLARQLHASLVFAVPLAVLAGAGALVGDMVESAIKRILRIQPGRALPYWDGVDYILGAMCFLLPWHIPSWPGIVALLIIAPLASLFANIIAFKLGWKQQWY